MVSGRVIDCVDLATSTVNHNNSSAVADMSTSVVTATARVPPRGDGRTTPNRSAPSSSQMLPASSLRDSWAPEIGILLQKGAHVRKQHKTLIRRPLGEDPGDEANARRRQTRSPPGS